MCLYLYIHIMHIHSAHIYYVNKNFYFGCDKLFDRTNIYIYIYTVTCIVISNIGFLFEYTLKYYLFL